MRLRVEHLADGPGPGEVVIAVTTASGSKEQVVVHWTAVEKDTIEIGYPIRHSKDKLLVELPRESASGRWRLWVSPELIYDPHGP